MSGCEPYAPAALYPQKDSWYSYLLDSGSTPGHIAARRIRSIEKLVNSPANEPATFWLAA
jgi:hypothetical protein